MTSPAAIALRKKLETKLAAHREKAPGDQPARGTGLRMGGHRDQPAPPPERATGLRMGGHRDQAPTGVVPPPPESPTARGSKEGLAPEREGHAGRRGDILEQFHTKTGMYEGRADDAAAPTILKVTIAGSGCIVWKTKSVKDGKSEDQQLIRINAEPGWFDSGESSAWSNNKGDMTFSGPMNLGGASDSGTNSIDSLVKQVPQVILKALPSGSKGENVILILKAHSRGAVAASMIAKRLKSALPSMKVELTQFDPVPGPMNRGEKQKIDLGETTDKKGNVTAALDETTLVYSAGSGYGITINMFAPQKVSGVKRIIVSRQVHGGGIRHGYVIGNEKFKGARLNSMPPGAYYESEVIKGGDDDGIGRLQRMSEDNFLQMLKQTFENRQAKIGDADRESTIKAAVKEFFKRNG